MKRDEMTNALVCALDLETFDRLAPHFEVAPFERGHVFYQPGDPVDRVYFPHKGVVSVLSVMADGAAVETSTVGRESAVGLLAALAHVAAFSRVIGQTSGVASSIDAARLRRLAEESPRLRSVIVRHCDALLAQAQQSVACNALHDVEERFCRWLLTCSDRSDGGEMRLTQEFLAMMLGVQRTTVSQVASTLQEAGAIRYQRGRVTITDRDALMRRSCECYERLRGHIARVLPTTPAPDGPCLN